MSSVAVVTGANQGLGIALVEGLAKQLQPEDFVYLTGRDAGRVTAAGDRHSAHRVWDERLVWRRQRLERTHRRSAPHANHRARWANHSARRHGLRPERVSKLPNLAYPYDSPLGAELQADVLERFLRYVTVDTQSDRSSDTHPSTARQLDLCRLLVDELHELGIDEVELTAAGHVMATIPAIDAAGAPTVGLLAHVDTSPAACGRNVEPQLWRNYDGSALVLSGDRRTVLSPNASSLLAERVGHDIVTSDGTTLLGADDRLASPRS